MEYYILVLYVAACAIIVGRVLIGSFFNRKEEMIDRLVQKEKGEV